MVLKKILARFFLVFVMFFKFLGMFDKKNSDLKIEIREFDQI